ncbi:MAG: transcription-repair coupling factor [Rhodospirillales bacterium]|nr:transcription-repair coupling factor [Rhodospirillales bacterium]
MTANAAESSPRPVSSTQNILFGAPEGQDARLLLDMARDAARDDKILLHVALDDVRLATLRELLGFFGPDADILSFPAWDCLPYDRVSPGSDLMAERVSTLCSLLGWREDKRRKPRILLTTVNAVTQRVPPPGSWTGRHLLLKKGGKFSQKMLEEFLGSNGYIRTDTVREAGEYALRGGIVDLFPAGFETPVRIDLFGDDIETLKTFDPETQSSLERIPELSLQPAREYPLDEDGIARFRQNYRAAFGIKREIDPLYESVSNGRIYNGMEHWLPLFYEQMATLFDYTGDPVLSFDSATLQSAEERHDQIADFYQARKTLEASQTQKKSKDVSLSGAVYHPLSPDLLYLKDEEWHKIAGPAKILSPFPAPDHTQNNDARKGRDFADIRALPDGDVFAALKGYLRDLPVSRKVLLTAHSDGARDRLKGLLENAGVGDLRHVNTYEDLKKLKPGQISLGVLSLAHGIVSEDLVIVTEQDILGDQLARRSKGRKKADNFLREVSSLQPGDLVVHIDHGIGRFEALETLSAAGTLHDCLKIIYSGGDKLYVPVENIEVLSRFGSAEGTTQLDKLGGAGWQARKSKVKKDLMRIAGHLLEIAAARQLQKSDPLLLEPAEYQKFAARFPYAETEDQARSIDSVLHDLAQNHPMDRLVCGDVGFGKTEVAIRAAYVAAKAGAQVALVVPTTLLARQHAANFMKRFEHTGLRVAQLSRMVDAKDAKLVKKGLEDGAIHIVIGTHAVLSGDVKFANLGLLIIDEEQRFGVKQKEKLKGLKKNIHVLTLTATPIPRTLQLSLSGVRELSLITTPPIDRLAIRTFVTPFDPLVIREALLREHYRGGQSFYVCPRIKDMTELAEQIRELVPEIRLITAHGQMTPHDLDDRMTAFHERQYDVLLATNIIESGIDIPSANTMIVHRADMFGLAQLYQIRGRIGRSKVRAYAYLTYEANKKLTDQGQKRLEVISTLDTLGAGFQLASHDMDIRGAGNLLGEEQSGHIKEVGVELYQQMLEEAVAAARAGVSLTQEEIARTGSFSPQINLGTSVLIPEEYVPDLGVRMTLYRRLPDLENGQEVEQFAAELIDRFGPLPQEVENLLDIVKIKQACIRAGIDRIDAGPKGAVIGFHNDSPPNLQGLVRWMSDKKGTAKLRPDQKISIPRTWDDVTLRVKGVKKLVKELEDCI